MRVDLGYFEHPKVRKLERLLGEAAALLPLKLWRWAVLYARDGEIEPDQVLDVAIACGWPEKPERLIAHFERAGFLARGECGRLLIHDWSEHQGKVVDRARADAQRHRDYRARQRAAANDGRAEDVQETSAARPQDARTTAAAPAEDEAPRPPRAKPEIDWRIERCWQTYLDSRERFYREIDGAVPSSKPSLTPEIRDAIKESLRAHDRDLLGAADREAWESSSRVRAAAEGLFLDRWHTGRDPNNAKRFLEAWRPWKRQRGKADPVERFADLAFEQRARCAPELIAPRLATIPIESAPRWFAIRKRLASALTRDEFETWIAPLEVVSEDEDGVTMLAPNARFVYAVEENYRSTIDRETAAVTSEFYLVRLTSSEQLRRTA